MAHILVFPSDYKGSLGNWISTWSLCLWCHLGASGDLFNSFLKHGCSTCDVTIAVVGIQGNEASIPVQLWTFRIAKVAFPGSLLCSALFHFLSNYLYVAFPVFGSFPLMEMIGVKWELKIVAFPHLWLQHAVVPKNKPSIFSSSCLGNNG